MRQFTKGHDKALGLARVAMHVNSIEGCSLQSWRNDVQLICKMCNVSAPDDYLAWVTGGDMKDADIADRSRAFGMQRVR